MITSAPVPASRPTAERPLSERVGGYRSAWAKAWRGAVVLAFVNGALHEGYQDALGEKRAERVSSVALSCPARPVGPVDRAPPPAAEHPGGPAGRDRVGQRDDGVRVRLLPLRRREVLGRARRCLRRAYGQPLDVRRARHRNAARPGPRLAAPSAVIQGAPKLTASSTRGLAGRRTPWERRDATACSPAQHGRTGTVDRPRGTDPEGR